MSNFEIITTVLSIIAIALSILIPLSQWIWKKWIVRGKLKYYPVGQATLFFNQSGSYVQVNGVLESINKSISVRKMCVVIRRQKDNKELNLTWAHLISPVNQSLVGNYMRTIEAAHPFRIDSDSIMCAFTEFSDPFDSFGKTFRNSSVELFKTAKQSPIFQSLYSDAESTYTKSIEYAKVKQIANNEFFWEIGKYSLDIVINYNNSRKVFSYTFSVAEQEYNELKHNIDESLLAPLKCCYNEKLDFRSVFVELSEQ